MDIPTLIELPKIGNSELGFVSVAESSKLPFAVQRVYWIYFAPDCMVRGHHAHRKTKQIIFAVSGQVEFVLQNIEAQEQRFLLDSPNIGLYIPQLHWRTVKFFRNAVLMCLASTEYDDHDYIRSYEEFRQFSCQ